ncbi:MAG: division/cell wall cluster transcriptional repressor MraZ [Pseudomonadota bacterium]
MFFGQFENGIDAKGRVSVPSGFRSAVAQGSHHGVYVWRSFNGPFLEGGGDALLAELAASMEGASLYDSGRNALERQIFGGIRPLSFDSTGRVTLPKDFAEHAGLTGRAVFVGVLKRFEIWSPEAYAGQEVEDRALAFKSKDVLKPPVRVASPAPTSGSGGGDD